MNQPKILSLPSMYWDWKDLMLKRSLDQGVCQLNSMGLWKAGLKESWLWFHASISVVCSILGCVFSFSVCFLLWRYSDTRIWWRKIIIHLFPTVGGGTKCNRCYHHRCIIVPPACYCNDEPMIINWMLHVHAIWGLTRALFRSSTKTLYLI